MIELLVVIAIIGTLASMLLPALAKSKSKAQGTACINNQRQLALGWRLYVDDNDEKLPYSYATMPSAKPFAWVNGYLDYNDDNPSNWDIETDLAKSPIWGYCGKSAGIWKCPSDRSMAKANGRNYPRVRSVSMNSWVGGSGDDSAHPGNPFDSDDWRVYKRMGDMADPGPAGTFVFLDEREDSVNDSQFIVKMDGYPDKPGSAYMVNFPANYHNNSGNFSLADVGSPGTELEFAL